jgi:hypothetical protein
VVRVSLSQPLELAAAARLPFISPAMNLYFPLLVHMFAGLLAVERSRSAAGVVLNRA